MTEQDRQRLVRLLGMLGSEHAGERDNAARLAEQFRREVGATWDDLLTGQIVYVDRQVVVERWLPSRFRLSDLLDKCIPPRGRAFVRSAFVACCLGAIPIAAILGLARLLA